MSSSTLLLILFVTISLSYSVGCDLYLAPSKIKNAGRGIIAGREYKKNEYVIDEAITMIMSYRFSDRTSLSNYVFASDDELYPMLAYGATTLFNHHSNHTVSNIWATNKERPDASVQKTSSNTIYAPVSMKANHDITIGSEIFTSYGDSDWFTARSIEYDEVPVDSIDKYNSIEELERVGHCLSSIYVDHSTLPYAGKGAFASKNFTKGEIVSVSPVLLFEMDNVVKYGTDNSVMINSMLGHPNSDVLILPIGSIAMVNHQSVKTGRNNVVFEWCDMFNNRHNKDTPLNVLLSTIFSPLDIAYRATRDIAAGEELFLDYGEKFSNQHSSYLTNLLNYHQNAAAEDAAAAAAYAASAESSSAAAAAAALSFASSSGSSSSAAVSAAAAASFAAALASLAATSAASVASATVEAVEASALATAASSSGNVSRYDEHNIDESHTSSEQPEFRQYIVVPDDFFPPSWYREPSTPNAIDNDSSACTTCSAI